MKKLIGVLCFIAVLLCGCGEKNAIPIAENISFSAELVCDEEEYLFSAELKDEKMNVCLTDPAALSGMTLCVTKGGVKAEYMGLDYSSTTDTAAPLCLIYSIFCDIKKSDGVPVDGGNCVLSGEVGGREYELEFSPSGLPLVLNAPSEKMTLIFNDVVILK